ncbi:hypothetical protein [Bacillus subtilis]
MAEKWQAHMAWHGREKKKKWHGIIMAWHGMAGMAESWHGRETKIINFIF